METSDKIESQFGAEGDFGYITRLQELRTSINKVIDELIAAQDGEPSLIEALNNYVKASGLTASLDAGGHQINNAGNASQPTDLVTLQQLTALVQAGSTDPGQIALTALGVGSLADGELPRNVDGSLVGFDPSNLVTAATLAQQVALLNQTLSELQTKLNETEGLALVGMS